MNKSLWTEWETERKTLWILSIDLKNDSVLPPSVFELNSSALSLIRQTQNYSIFCVSAFIDRDECATNRDRQDRLKERRKPMPINSCSWGFNFSKKSLVCVHTTYNSWLCRQFRACTRASHTPLMRVFFLLSNLHACTPTPLSLSLFLSNTLTHSLCFYHFHQPRISISSTKNLRVEKERERKN
jgi:hypothetical protein